MSLFLSIIVGAAIVVQNGLNHSFSKESGLTPVLFVNCVISLLVVSALMGLGYYAPQTLPEVLRYKNLFKFSVNPWWLIIPGISGFLIIALMPLAISTWGLFRVLCVVIVTQLVGGVLWDYFVLNLSISFMKILGGLVVLAGAILIAL